MVKTGTTLKPSVMMKVIFCGMFTAVGLVSENHICLTWDIKGYMLILQCRTVNFDDPVSFVDPAGIIQAKCSFNQECKSHHRNGKITGEYAQNKVIFSIDNIIPQYVNGKWTCVQGSIESTTNVSTTKGIIASTYVYLVGKFIETNKIKLTCSSCREPEGYYAEFYINEDSFTSVSYSNETGKCQQGTQECNPETCSCSVSGNVFTLVLQINKDKKEYSYGCEMRFTDSVQQYKFLQVATLYVNGANLFSNGTVTRFTKSAEKKFIPPTYNKTLTKLNTTESSIQTTTTAITRTVKDSETDTKGQEMLILVGVLSAMLVGVFLAFIFRKLRLKIKRDSSKRKSIQLAEEKHDTTVKDFDQQSIEETEALIETGAISRKDESSPLIAISHTDERKDMLQKRPSENKHKSYCEPCFASSKETVALHWCVECSERLCHQCKKIHSYMKMSCGHMLISIDEVTENYCLSHVVICEEHEGKNREYICMDHDEVYCKECIDANHKTCETMLLMLYDIESDLPRLIEQQMSQITQSLKVLEECKAECFEIKKYWELKASTIEKIVEKEIDDLILNEDSISSMSLKVTEVWRKLTSTKILEIEKDINSLENHVVLVNEQKTCIDFTNRYCSKMQLLKLIYSKIKPVLRDVNDQIQQVKNKKQEITLEPRQRHQTQVAVKVEKPQSEILVSETKLLNNGIDEEQLF